MRPHVFVVEGKNDKFRLEQILDNPLVITTNGSAIDLDKIKILKKLDATHDIILMFDPDHAGERIRRLVSKELTHVYHAFIPRDLAVSKKRKENRGRTRRSKKQFLRLYQTLKWFVMR